MTDRQPNSLLVTQADARSFHEQNNQKSEMEKKRTRAKSKEGSEEAKKKLVKQQQLTLDKLQEGGWKNVSLTPLALKERHYTGIRFWVFVTTQPSSSEENWHQCVEYSGTEIFAHTCVGILGYRNNCMF